MKKYLMTGIAALALCAGFTSCSHDLETYSQEELDNLEAQKNIATYKAAFENYIGGKVAASQTWGFSGTFATSTRAADPQANIWAASNGDKWIVPPKLTATQKDIVRQYFQQNPDPNYDDPEWTNYFVQQVYKGGSNTEGSKSLEKYESANSVSWNPQYVVGSDHMDQLCAVYDDPNIPKEHINNFNFGDYPNPYPNVLDYTKEVQYEKNDNEAHHHSDQIMLMVNSTTENFGYFNSDGSLGHTDYTGLVGWKKIYDWAKAKGISGYEELNDGWNRSYMGFDFEQVVGYDIYVHTDVDVLDEEGNVVKVVDKNGKTVNQKEVRYAKISDMSPAKNYAWDGERVFELTDEIKNSYLTYKDDNNVEHLIPLLVEQTNEYCGENHDIDGNSIYIKKQYPNSTQVDDVIDLTVFTNKAKAGQLPVVNSTLLKWVEVKGGADHYYSDWIVTLTKAEHYGTTIITTPGNVRVMAEDLTLGTTDEDFDFNDIVFDVYFGAANTAKVVIRAAGGTLDLRISNVETPTAEADWFEVHDLFNEKNGRTDCGGKMINTHGTDSDQPANVRSRSIDGLECPEFPLLFAVNSNADAKKIKIQVKRNNVWTDIDADQGQPAAKFAVPTTVDWMKERISIKNIYGEFTTWATSAPNLEWWLYGNNN